MFLFWGGFTPGLKSRPPKEEERALCTDSAHPYQNKGFANQNREFLSPLFSHTCAYSRLQPLCFDMLHKNTRGEGVTLVTKAAASGEQEARRQEKSGQ
jgi:hypothetical protein